MFAMKLMMWEQGIPHTPNKLNGEIQGDTLLCPDSGKLNLSSIALGPKSTEHRQSYNSLRDMITPPTILIIKYAQVGELFSPSIGAIKMVISKVYPRLGET